MGEFGQEVLGCRCAGGTFAQFLPRVMVVVFLDQARPPMETAVITFISCPMRTVICQIQP